VVEAEPVPEPVQESTPETVPEVVQEEVIITDPVQEEITIGTATSGNVDGNDGIVIGNAD